MDKTKKNRRLIVYSPWIKLEEKQIKTAKIRKYKMEDNDEIITFDLFISKNYPHVYVEYLKKSILSKSIL